MQISLKTNFPEVLKALTAQQKSVRSVMREALNQTTYRAESQVVATMRRVFDRPKPFTLRSLRVYPASTANLTSTLWFRQRSQDADKLWAGPQIAGGKRQPKPMELRLRSAGLLPAGWYVVPGAGANLDANGNMSQGEISRILNVLGALKESGYNKADDRTKARLKRGTKKAYGFEYFAVQVGSAGQGARRAGAKLQPGIYRRVITAFGTSIKPMMIFVNKANYKPRLDFEAQVTKAFERNFQAEFDFAWQSYQSTGSASGARRSRA